MKALDSCETNDVIDMSKSGFNTEDSVKGQCYMNIQTYLPNVQVDLAYAGENNFARQVLYPVEHMGYLLDFALEKLRRAYTLLIAEHPDCTFAVYDAARPLSVQRTMFELVKGTPQEKYVANPSEISMHNFGVAVDLSIINTATGLVWDMGCPFDTFGDMAEPQLEGELLLGHQLTSVQLDNRRYLRWVMIQAGFYHINSEWWHFNAMRYEDAIKNLHLIA